MTICESVGCSNCSDHCEKKKWPTSTTFFPVPKVIEGQCERAKQLSANRRRASLERMKRVNFDEESLNVRVCEAHFVKAEILQAYGERTEKRCCEKRRAEFERHREQAAAVIVDAATEPVPQMYAAANAPSLPQHIEDADKTETGVSLQRNMTVSDIEASQKKRVHLK
ncbi:hypothetical protein HPB51_029550 [Rhipicephalus microplus]|uniref:THAP-type domain-containing protein n=1 Tax=Rhipicephalus microplus TaxID=6941 RepID=A0A9J6CTT8_RHIMP|nr:hypothetical protein HPB51_029550 [Rhipicephalus microplus]